MRTFRVLALATAAAITVAVACSSPYDGDTSATPDDGGTPEAATPPAPPPPPPPSAEASAPATLAAAQQAPTELVVFGGAVYWRSTTEGKVMTVDVDGGLPRSAACSNVRGLAVDARGVYSICFCNVVQTPLDGGAPAVSQTACSLGNIVLDATYLYTTSNSVSVRRMGPLATFADSGLPTVYAYGSPVLQDIAEHGGNIVHTTSSQGVGRVAYVPSSGGAPTTLAPNEVEPRGITVDAVGAAWINIGDAGVGAAVRAESPLGAAPVDVAKGDFVPDAIAIDATYVYFASVGTAPDFADAAILRARRDGTSATPEVLARGEAAVQAIALDDAAIYWTTLHQLLPDGGAVAGTGTVRKLVKP